MARESKPINYKIKEAEKMSDNEEIKHEAEEIKIEPEEQKGVSEEEVKWAAGGTST